MPGDMLKSFFEALIFSLTVVGISNQYAVDLSRVTAGNIAVDLGILLAAVADEDELPSGISIEDLFDCSRFGLGPLDRKSVV